jgi:hypothetical protein
VLLFLMRSKIRKDLHLFSACFGKWLLASNVAVLSSDRAAGGSVGIIEPFNEPCATIKCLNWSESFLREGLGPVHDPCDICLD